METRKKQSGNISPPHFLDPNSIYLSSYLSQNEKVSALLNLDHLAPFMYEVLQYGEWLDLPLFISHDTMSCASSVTSHIPPASLDDISDDNNGEKIDESDEESSELDEKEGGDEREKGAEGDGKGEGGRKGSGKSESGDESEVTLSRLLMEIGEDKLGGMIVLPRDFTLEYFRNYLRENLSKIRSEREAIRRKGELSYLRKMHQI
jgi:hypothetical protein